jgi:hypothetical protein
MFGLRADGCAGVCHFRGWLRWFFSLRFVFALLLFACASWLRACCRRCLVRGGGGGLARCSGWSGGEAGEGLAPAFAGFGWQAVCRAAGGFRLPRVPGAEDALVADDEQRGGEQHEGCQAHEAAPAAADVVAGGVLGGGEPAFGAGAPVAGAAPGGGGVVVFLRGFGEHVRGDGDRLLGAAGLGVFGGLEDLGAVPVQGH